MKILFDYIPGGINECKIMADDHDDQKHLLEVRDKIVELLGASTTVEVTKEELEAADLRSVSSAATTDLLTTGGC